MTKRDMKTIDNYSLPVLLPEVKPVPDAMKETTLLLLLAILLPFYAKADMVQAKTFIGPQNILEYHRISEKKSACVTFAWRDRFCSSFSLKYPYTRSIQHKDIAKILDARIEELSKNYNNSIYDQKEVIEELNPDSNDTGHFDWDKTIDIFSFTPRTLTLNLEESRYTGGAHGSYDVYFENYDLTTKREIDLDDLIVDHKKFEHIVEKIYRKTYHIPANKDMTYDGWFDKEFRLTSNFALTPKGFYFLYNSYAIKSYADGQTPLFVSYNKVKEVLSTSYFTQDFFHKANRLAHTYTKEFDDDLSISITPAKHDRLRIVLDVKNNSYYKRYENYLSVTFVGEKDVIVSAIKHNFDFLKRYPNGIGIYHKPSGKNIKKHDVLLEAYSKILEDDDSNNTRQLSFEIQKPKNKEKLTLLLRMVSKNNYSPDSRFYKEGVTGQQGYYNYKVELEL
jgi:hypothetical protein